MSINSGILIPPGGGGLIINGNNIDTVDVNNGLTFTAGTPGTIQLGGNLIQNTAINLSARTLTIECGNVNSVFKLNGFDGNTFPFVEFNAGGLIKIGKDANNTANSSIAIGLNANTGGSDNAICIGRDTIAGVRGVAVGYQVRSDIGGADGVAFGHTIASRATNVAIGREITGGVGGNTYIGHTITHGSRAQGGSHTIVGNDNTLNFGSIGFNASQLTLLGNDLRVTNSGNFGSKVVLLGSNITANVNNGGSIAIGSGSGTGGRLSVTIDDTMIIGFRSPTPSFFFNKNGNLVIASTTTQTAGSTFEASAKNCITIHADTEPTTGITGASVQWAAPAIDATATTAQHFLSEDNKEVILYPFVSFGTPTGTKTTTTFDTATVTVSELAERVYALIDALELTGLIETT